MYNRKGKNNIATKKDKIFLAGFLAFVLTMLVGYALFSQQIEINGTAKAEEKFTAGEELILKPGQSFYVLVLA